MDNNKKHIYSVSEISKKISLTFDKNFSFFWIYGEISNLFKAQSGHLYFVLKDKDSQINAVIFDNLLSRTQFEIKEGKLITGLGRLNLYEKRGTYQIVFEHIESYGKGALFLEFEKLKMKLKKEGLFDEKDKKKLPKIPSKVAVITSASGAVIHDILDIIKTRFENMKIDIVPVKVQGDDAAKQIIKAILLLNKLNESDIIIIARGGGSVEDLMPFNDEALARCIFASKIPIVSAVGHETDFTISDFVADVRAATPSVAAQICVPEKAILQDKIHSQKQKLERNLKNTLEKYLQTLSFLKAKIVNPKKKIEKDMIYLDDINKMLKKAFFLFLQKKRQEIDFLSMRLSSKNIQRHFENLSEKYHYNRQKINVNFQTLLNIKKNELNALKIKLDALSPLSVLERGYSITKDETGKIILDSMQIQKDEDVMVLLNKGSLLCKVKKIM